MTAALEVEALSVTYGGLKALDGVDLTVGVGTVHGLIGPNGAGKTTCIDALTGFVPGARGRISLLGSPIDGLAAHRRARAGLVRTFQSVELFDDLNVHDNVLVAALPTRWWSPFADALRPSRSRHGHDEVIEEALAAVGLSDAAQLMPTQLSNGQRRLVGIARALVMRPQVVLLDEPAAGLDPTETAALGALIRRLPEGGMSVLLVDHDMNLVLDVCDAITVIDFGRVIAHGPPADVRGDQAVISAYLGGVALDGAP